MSAKKELSENTAQARWESCRRMVVKVGSTLLVDQASGKLRREWIESLADDIADMQSRGREILIVSSGAVALGRNDLALPAKTLRLEEKQAAAAAGQTRLMQAWQAALERHGIKTAQVLLTISDTEERRRHLNARGTLETLLRLKAVPVINENDTVATEEIRFGDNDRLAARVAQMAGADTLVLLSDIDGLYTADPRRDAKAALIPEVREITPAIEQAAGKAAPGYGSGGMVTKLMAARIAMNAGCRMVIALGTGLHALAAAERQGGGTWFLPAATPRSAHKRWIAGTLNPQGSMTVDKGAANALSKGNSLLPAGVTDVEGKFERGDAVIVKSAEGRELGRGLSAYSSGDAKRIMGHKSGEIEELLGYRGREELIHRDDLVLSGALASEGAALQDQNE
ncbi:MAG TPA: glutamate 5-kinase [Alphaproteobacteria bacterium]|jgi:glutamate 5-kinase|nr:glutamate 5-kinase [Alphaproteobacteria bacterium]